MLLFYPGLAAKTASGLWFVFKTKFRLVLAQCGNLTFSLLLWISVKSIWNWFGTLSENGHLFKGSSILHSIMIFWFTAILVNQSATSPKSAWTSEIVQQLQSWFHVKCKILRFPQCALRYCVRGEGIKISNVLTFLVINTYYLHHYHQI